MELSRCTSAVIPAAFHYARANNAAQSPILSRENGANVCRGTISARTLPRNFPPSPRPLHACSMLCDTSRKFKIRIKEHQEKCADIQVDRIGRLIDSIKSCLKIKTKTDNLSNINYDISLVSRHFFY